MKFLAMHITNQFWYIYGRKYLHGNWSLLNILMTFGIKENLTFVLLASATNIALLLQLSLSLSLSLSHTHTLHVYTVMQGNSSY